MLLFLGGNLFSWKTVNVDTVFTVSKDFMLRWFSGLENAEKKKKRSRLIFKCITSSLRGISSRSVHEWNGMYLKRS